MSNSVIAVYDGHVLRPETALELEVDTRYRVTITKLTDDTGRNAWDVLDELTGTVDAPIDWASEHDHYIYGSPLCIQPLSAHTAL